MISMALEDPALTLVARTPFEGYYGAMVVVRHDDGRHFAAIEGPFRLLLWWEVSPQWAHACSVEFAEGARS